MRDTVLHRWSPFLRPAPGAPAPSPALNTLRYTGLPRAARRGTMINLVNGRLTAMTTNPNATAGSLRRGLAAIAAIFFLPLGYAVTAHYTDGSQAVDWRSARRDSSGLAPDPVLTREAVIQVYAARAVRWRGAFGVHTWITAKPQGADHYNRFEVIGFGVARGGKAVRVRSGVPDAYWFGSRPTLLREVRGGAEVDRLIERLHAAAASYPYDGEYRVWPGPNSNTFVAHLARALPELRLELPPTAIGKDYLPGGAVVARSPSGSGLQLSLGGVLGVTVALEEGFEFNLLGLSAGIDLWPPALKLPGIGRLGLPEHDGPHLLAPEPAAPPITHVQHDPPGVTGEAREAEAGRGGDS